MQQVISALADSLPTTRQSLAYGLRMKCPKCGIGNIFKSYLKPRDACPHCHESFIGIRADDGPAWLTILITGHMIVPILVLLETSTLLPDWGILAIILLTTSIFVLLLLPVTKGFFIAAIWVTSRKKRRTA
jgi:uncharacterized protein (DUF983 family)